MHTYNFKMWYFDIWCQPTCSATLRIVFRCLKYNTRAHPFLLQTFIINWLTLDKLSTLLQLMGPSDFQLSIHWILIISKRTCVVSSSPACTKFGKTKILRNYHWIPSFENIINPSSPWMLNSGTDIWHVFPQIFETYNFISPKPHSIILTNTKIPSHFSVWKKSNFLFSCAVAAIENFLQKPIGLPKTK